MILALISDFQAIVFPTWLSDEAFSIGPLSVKWYGLAYLVGVFGAYYYANRLCQRKDIWIANGATRLPEVVPTKTMLQDLMFYCLLGIIIGGRLGYILFYSTSTIWEAPLDIFKVWTGGMSFHGGFLGVVAACAYASWRTKVSKLRIGDMASVGAPIGLGLVRLTNFVNEELYGRVTDVPWAFIFSTAPDSQPRHPSQLYEAFLEGFVLWLILRILCTKFKALTKPGVVFGALMFFYGIFRFSVEFVRTPDNIPQFGTYPLIGELTRGMAYSLPMILVGGVLMVWAWKRSPVSPKRVADPETAKPQK